MRYKDLFENNELIDNVKGWGTVPDNQEVDYKGLRVLMRPRTFTNLVAPLNREPSQEIVQHIKQGGKIGSPFLVIEIPDTWEEGVFDTEAKVVSHEGRNRMQAILDNLGNIPVETHLFFTHGIRNRHLTPEIIRHLNIRMIKERSQDVVQGPLFSVM